MPINKLALIRYKVIDNCLQNRYRQWTLEDLVEACSEALNEFEGITKGVSKRTVQLDLQIMRSEKLGYNAPIIVTDKKYYTYEDKKYSITNIPLTGQDLSILSEVVGVLKQFKGFGYFQELTGMVNKLEDKIYKQQHKGKSYIHFETNDLLKGLEFIDPLHKAIINRQPVQIQYQSFRARQPSNHIYFPYLLKEYRNRWFALVGNKNGMILTLALDRIVEVNNATGEKFVEPSVNMDSYFDDVIGVTKNIEQKPVLIILEIDRENAPYVITKPLHNSQKIIERKSQCLVFSIEVIWNFELERELLGFGESIKVLSPKKLKGRISYRAKKIFENYVQ
jgi:predicted DNA-binding transcriptional regulator YafY